MVYLYLILLGEGGYADYSAGINMKEKIIGLLKKTKDGFVTVYTGGNSTLAIIITVTALMAASVAGIFLIKTLTADTVIAANPESSSIHFISQETTEFIDETTTKEPATEEVTTEETTTEETTMKEITTTEPYTVPEIIPIEELTTISNEAAEDFDSKLHAAESATEAPTEAPTKPSNKPTTNPPIYEVAKVVSGIDVSKWQGDIDWTKVKNDGIDFVIIKAAGRSTGSDGSLYEDSKFKQNIEGALANGIQVGVYFFSQAITVQEAREEASLIISLIKDYKITYPVVFDWETAPGFRNHIALSKSTMNNMASTFCDMVKAAGYTPMIYGNTWDLANRYNTEEISKKYKVWIARYLNKYLNTGVRYQPGDPLPAYDYSYQMWQYGSTGRVNGINGNVDMNVSFFTYGGAQVPTSPIKLNIPDSTLDTLKGTAIDLMAGITAFNTAGLDVTSSVQVAIQNSNGDFVGATDGFNTVDTYTLTYTIKDFTGASKSAVRTLIVRDVPTMTVHKDTLTYSYDASIEDILEGFESNFVTALDYMGNDISTSLTTTYDDALNQFIEDGLIEPGTYMVTYTAADSYGASVSLMVTLNITEPETSSNQELT